MNRDYIPPKDADLLAWSTNFDTLATATPAAFGLSAGQAAAFAALQVTWVAAYAAAVNPATRTPVTVAAKDAARAAIVASARMLAGIVQSFPSITDGQLASLGLTVPDPVPSPIPAPVTSPVLSLVAIQPGLHVLKSKDSVLANPRSRPAGAIALQLWRKIGPAAPASLADCTFVGQYSRVPMSIATPPASVGEQAHYLAVWVTAKGLIGPLSNVLTATIAA